MNFRQTALLSKAYAAFNTRQIEDVLKLMHADVEWPNGWEGGYVYGREAVKDYWIRQWKELAVKVTVNQKVKDLRGNVITDRTVYHTYFFKDGLIRRMEIEE
jgi:hypothetical protein